MIRSRHLAILLALMLGVGACSGDGPGSAPPEYSAIHTSAQWWMSVVAVEPDDQWIVGGTTDQGEILRFDGESVTPVDHGSDVGLLNWMMRFPSGEMVVVGNSGGVLRSGDGVGWEQDPVVTDQDLWGVWGSAPDDVWAVGGGDRATILRDTGSGFAEVEVPDLVRPGVATFFKVWGSGPDDVYIVGENGAVLHWDGTALVELAVGVGQDLIGVWGTGPDRVAVVGGRTNAVAALWDGDSWRTLDLGRFSGLNGVWLDDDTVHIVGNDGQVGIIDFPSGKATIAAVDTPVAIHAVNGTDSTLTAVGGDFSTGPSGPFLGQVLTAER